MSPSLPGKSSLELPGILHHDGEVVVAIDGAADALVVLAELVERHNAVRLLRVPLAHELLEDLLGSLLALDHLWVLTCVVDLSDVSQSDLTILGHVQLLIGSSDPFFTFFIKVTLDTNLMSTNSNPEL